MKKTRWWICRNLPRLNGSRCRRNSISDLSPVICNSLYDWGGRIRGCVGEDEMVGNSLQISPHMMEAFFMFQRTMVQWQTNNCSMTNAQCFKCQCTIVR